MDIFMSQPVISRILFPHFIIDKSQGLLIFRHNNLCFLMAYIGYTTIIPKTINYKVGDDDYLSKRPSMDLHQAGLAAILCCHRKVCALTTQFHHCLSK